MHSAQGGTCRIKIPAEQDPPINTHALKETAEQQKFLIEKIATNIAIKNIPSSFPRIYHSLSVLWLLQGFVKNMFGRRERTSLSSNSPFRLQSRPDLQRADSSVSGYLASSSELLIFFAALGGGAHLKGGLVTGGAAPALKGWCISFRYSPQRF